MLKDNIVNNLKNSDIISTIRSKFLFLDRDGKIPINLASFKGKGVIYCIENLKNGKRYIGKTVDLLNRSNHYILAARRNKPDGRPFECALVDEGIENFRMYPLEVTTNRRKLADLEIEYMYKFDTLNPEKGYNTSTVKNYRSNKGKGGHPHTVDSKISRSKLVACINPTTKKMIISVGMKLFGDIVGTSKDIIKNNAKRGSRAFGFYIIYINETDRQDILERQEKKYQYFLESCARLGKNPQANNYEEYFDFVNKVSLLVADCDASVFTDLGYECYFLTYNEDPNGEPHYVVKDISEFLEILDAMYNNDED